MPATRTARERARAELTKEIKDEARRQLAGEGAHRLSLRSVARELGMVSSALYRYFPSRDELLTALIVDAYNAAADAMDAAVEKAIGPRAGWLAGCAAVRDWALANPHEYALIYGSPVPGYQAPQDTIGPAARIPLRLIGLAQRAWEDKTLEPPGKIMPKKLDAQLAALAAEFAPGLPNEVLARLVVAWSQLFGMISFELFGQFVGSVEPAGPFAEYAIAELADFVGLI